MKQDRSMLTTRVLMAADLDLKEELNTVGESFVRNTFHVSAVRC